MRVKREKITLEQIHRAIELGLFQDREQTAEEVKRQLIVLAREGSPKPKYGTTLNNCLGNYTRKTQSCYDDIFNKEIRRVAPHWFVSRQEIAKITKKLLMVAASYKSAKPICNSRLGSALKHFTSKHSTAFDPEFSKSIRELCPDWFLWKADSTGKKAALLEIARTGKERPKEGPLYNALQCYITKNNTCYDAIFDEEIRKVAPRWFMANVIQDKKDKLIQLALEHAKKPSWGSPLGGTLKRLTCEKYKMYDVNFCNKIKFLSPRWFKK